MKRLVWCAVAVASFGGAYWLSVAFTSHRSTPTTISKADVFAPKSDRLQSALGRSAYWHRLLRDPETDRIPENIRAAELAFAERLASTLEVERKDTALPEQQWMELGPSNVGGRTRALAIDRTDPEVMIAGGVSGGIWKSLDGGLTWRLKTPGTEALSVSWVVQDPREGRDHIWYYATGEALGNSASDPAAFYVGGTTPFMGSGIYKSQDRGDTWTLLPATLDADRTTFDQPFNFVLRMEMSPVTGHLFVATYGYGIFRSVDEGTSFQQILGGDREFAFSDIAVASDGMLLATLSSARLTGAQSARAPGVYLSLNDGQTWSEVTPATFPTEHRRSFTAFAPSDPTIAYTMTYTGQDVNGEASSLWEPDDVRMHRLEYDRAGGEAVFTDRTQNMPRTAGNNIRHSVQGGYNMILAVKPDDPNFVVMGMVGLYRTLDGFATPYDDSWLIGYGDVNFHVDQHAIAFMPDQPDVMWIGNDGGLQMTRDVTGRNMNWQSGNRGYNVTQFYHVSIPDVAGDGRVMGGTQDNGSPFLVWSETEASLGDVSGGDGSFSAFAQNYLYASSQSGYIIRFGYEEDPNLPGVPLPSGSDVALAYPPDAEDQLFINPFAIDPLDEDVIYYPAGRMLWRNTAITGPRRPDYTLAGWEQLTQLAAPVGTIISALSVTHTPAHVLYYASSGTNQFPQVHRLAQAHVATSGAQTHTVTGASPGSYLHDIAINPQDGDELLVTLTNYNVRSLFHSVDGGVTWTDVEGNLADGFGQPGPSIRSATIQVDQGNKTYYLATSIGVFSTRQLQGEGTLWQPEGVDVIGNTVVSKIVSRTADATVVAASHGRGLFGKVPTQIHRLVFPWVSNRTGQFASELVIYNLSASAQTVELTARRADGETETTSRSIPSKGFLREPAASLFPDLGSGSGYCVVLETVSDRVEGSWNTYNLVAASGSSPSQGMAVRVPESGTANDRAGQRVLYSYLPLNDDFVSAPVVVNLHPDPQNISLTFTDASGNVVAERELTQVAPFTPFAQVVNTLVPEGTGAVSMTARGSRGAVSGASFVFNEIFQETAIGNVTTLLEDSSGDLFSTVMYPWISNNQGLFESLLIANNWGQEGFDVLLTARRADGSSEVVTREIPAGGFFAERASSLFPQMGSGAGYSVEMSAPDPHIEGAFVTYSLAAASGGSPAFGVAAKVPEDASLRVGNILFFGAMPSSAEVASAPVVVNCANRETDVVLDFFDASGTLVFTDTQSIRPLGVKAPFAALTRDLLPKQVGEVYVVARTQSAVLTGASFVFDNTFVEPAIGNATVLDFSP